MDAITYVGEGTKQLSTREIKRRMAIAASLKNKPKSATHRARMQETHKRLGFSTAEGNAAHEQVWAVLEPLGYQRCAVFGTGKGGKKRWSATRFVVDAFHPGLGICIEVDEGVCPLPQRKLEFLRTYTRGVYIVSTLPDILKNLKEVLAQIEKAGYQSRG